MEEDLLLLKCLQKETFLGCIHFVTVMIFRLLNCSSAVRIYDISYIDCQTYLSWLYM